METEEYKIEAKDGAALCLRLTKPEGQPKGVLCLVHGLGDYGGCFSHLVSYFGGASFAVMSVDLHGNGSSEGERGHADSLDILYDDIALLLAQAREKLPAVPLFLYGHSLGGNLVLNYALRRKPEVAGVIAASPWLELAEHPVLKRLFAGLLDKIRPGYILDAGIDAAKLSHDPDFVQNYAQDPLIHGKISIRLLAASCKSGVWAVRHAAEFRLPLLLMHGGADKITGVNATRRFYARVLPGTAILKIWDGDFHSLHNEKNRQAIFDFVRIFLLSHTKKDENPSASGLHV